MSFLRGHWQLLALSALVLALWTTPAILPLKILVVFLHELSHGLAALATGGSVESITVNADQGGLTVTRGGSRFWILSAGYLGSLLLGLLFLFAALRTRLDRAFLALLGALVLAVTALYMRELFAAGFGVFAGVAMLAMARYLPHQVNDLFLRLIGLTCLFYAPLDIFSDTIQRAHLRSDAYMLGREFGGGGVVWGVLWLALSLAAIAASLRFWLGTDSNVALSRKAQT